VLESKLKKNQKVINQSGRYLVLSDQMQVAFFPEEYSLRIMLKLETKQMFKRTCTLLCTIYQKGVKKC